MLAELPRLDLKITRAVTARIPTDAGEFQLSLYENNLDGKEHMALIHGDVNGRENVLVRVHSECFTGDVLGSLRCDCGEQLQRAISAIAEAECGIILYMRQEGRGIGLAEKLRAYNLQDDGLDTVDANLELGHGADERDYTIAAEILRDLNVTSIKLITNNPTKIEALEALDIQVSMRVPSIATNLTADNRAYLDTKIERMRHMLSLQTPLPARPNQVRGPIPFIQQALAKQSPTRPSITLSYAQTLDGAITSQQGRPTNISGQASHKLTHELRAAHEGILVGINTVLSDNPRLTVRLVEGKNPTPIILDSCLRLPLDARFIQPGRRVIVLTSQDANQEKEDALRAVGVTVLRIPCTAPHKLSLPHALQALHELGIASVMIEGGAHVIQSFLTAELIDQAVVTLSPKFMGGYHVVNGPALTAQPKLHNPQQMMLDDDIILWGKIHTASQNISTSTS